MKNKDYNFFKKEVLEKQPKLRDFAIKNLKRYLQDKSEFNLEFNPRIRKLKNYHNYKFFIVNGELIRDKIDIDFVMGGNGFRYLYIPIDEIWVEKDYIKSKEIKYILLHEYTELSLMKKGINYPNAHDIASIKELRLRRK